MHLGVLTFLRRSRRPYPPLQAPAPVPSPVGTVEEASPSPPLPLPVDSAVETEADPWREVARPFLSSRYGYRLIMPPGWRNVPAPAAPGTPVVERFASEHGGRHLEVWSEPCPIKRLPLVPLADRVASIALASGLVVPFVAYEPLGQPDTVFLEGRWLHRGRRWTVNARLPAADRTEGINTLREMVTSLSVEV